MNRTIRSAVKFEPLRKVPCGLKDLGAKRFGDIVPRATHAGVECIGALLRRHLGDLGRRDHLALLHKSQRIAQQLRCNFITPSSTSVGRYHRPGGDPGNEQAVGMQNLTSSSSTST